MHLAVEPDYRNALALRCFRCQKGFPTSALGHQACVRISTKNAEEYFQHRKIQVFRPFLSFEKLPLPQRTIPFDKRPLNLRRVFILLEL